MITYFFLMVKRVRSTEEERFEVMTCRMNKVDTRGVEIGYVLLFK